MNVEQDTDIDKLLNTYKSKMIELEHEISNVTDACASSLVVDSLMESMKKQESTFMDMVSTMMANKVQDVLDHLPSTSCGDIEGVFRQEVAIKEMREESASNLFNGFIPDDSKCVGPFNINNMKDLFLGERNVILPIISIYEKLLEEDKEAIDTLEKFKAEIEMKKPIYYEDIFPRF